jgi:ribosomal protein S18 acetylase RimI-like enzyme
MTSRKRSGNTVEAGVSPAWQSGSQPTRLPLQKNNIRIRDAKLGDAPELAALMCELGYETSSAEMRSRLQVILRNASYSTIVAEVDSKLFGMIGTLTHTSHEHNDSSGKIIALVVSKRHRRSGIGRVLIDAAEKDFAKKKRHPSNSDGTIRTRARASIL